MFWHPQDLPSNHGLQFHVWYNLGWQSQELRIMKREGDKRFIGEIQWNEYEPHNESPPTLSCRDNRARGESLQNLFDALWAAGFRPPAGTRADEVVGVKDEVIAAKQETLEHLRGTHDRLLTLVEKSAEKGPILVPIDPRRERPLLSSEEFNRAVSKSGQ